jgi:DNA-binding NarL/FixJ family response regulator
MYSLESPQISRPLHKDRGNPLLNLKSMQIQVGIADDQQLFLKSLCTLINTFKTFRVLVDAINGAELLNKLQQKDIQPDILLLDVNMPVMDGVKTAQMISQLYPAIRLVALSLKDDDASIISMIKAGCCAYLLKDIHPDELEKALLEVHTRGYYNADTCNIHYRRLISRSEKEVASILTAKEKIFLRLACSDMTYKQIASEMHLSERTIDGYRESLFAKLNVQSRVGMALEGLRRNLVSLDQLP